MFHFKKHIPSNSGTKVAKKGRTEKRKTKKHTIPHKYCFKPEAIYAQWLTYIASGRYVYTCRYFFLYTHFTITVTPSW